MKKTKVLITGISGFVGSSLTKHLLNQKKYDIRGLILPEDPWEKYIPNDVEKVYGDITDYNSIKDAFKGIDIVFHCAAYVNDWGPKEIFHKVNVLGIENVLKASAENNIKRFVDISTNDVFGYKEHITITEDFPLEYWGEPYPDTKIEAEKLVWKFYEKYNLDVSIVYPCWIYGPGDRTFIPLTAEAIAKKELIYWYRGTLVWPTFIGNLVEFLELIATDKRAIGEGFLLHDGICISFEELCSIIARALDTPPPKIRIPYSIAYILAYIMENVSKILKRKRRPLLTTYIVKNLGSHMFFSIEKAKKVLNYTPRISFWEGIDITMDWLKKEFYSMEITK